MLNFEELDHEFLTEGSPAAESEKIAGLIQQNLSPEEQKRLAEIIPVLEEYNMLMVKVQTGKSVEELEKSGELEALALRSGESPAIEVAQEGQTQMAAPSRPVQRGVAENAPKMMSAGGEVDISNILEGDKPDWLIRALDPSTEMTKNNESIRSYTGSMDGRQILVPSIRMVDGEFVRYKPEEAFRIAREKQDYLVIPAKSDEEAEAYSKALSNEISRRRQQSGMALGGTPPVIEQQQPAAAGPGGVAAGPVGVVDAPGADESGVADDVQAKSDGFVINAAAVKHAGLKDINEMIQSAKEYAEQKGIKLNFGKVPTDAEDILVSNGEVVIPDALANIIGYDKLEKINNRGKKETEEKLAAQEEGAPPEGPPPNTPPVLQDQMAGLT